MATTGKVFKCIGIQENKNFFWRQGFTIGNEYEEAELDSQNENHSDNVTLLLFDRNNCRAYVDRNQFIEIEKCSQCEKEMTYLEHNYGTEDIIICIHCNNDAQIK